MKRYSLLFALSFLGFTLMNSCTIQKRKHLRGWHITSKRVNKKASKFKPTSVVNLKRIKDSKASNESLEKSRNIEESSKTIEEITKSNSFLTQTTNDSKTRYQDSPQLETRVQSIQKLELNQNSELNLGEIKNSDSDEKSHWAAKMFGGILGVLLALIVVPPLALLILFFNNGDIDDDILFTVSRDNSPFIRAFKNCYNIVFKIGATIIVWGIIILGAILILAGIYVEYGIIGVLLGILGFLLLVWLMYLLLKGFVDLLFPSSR